ncbi:MAG: C4-dicarboxylate ABC transporter [SAR116 cluster bacterium]|nr:C4-dicarboxylate ABC transporter [SAR116 cluster bacterium]RPH00473.1 MAG: TRAP transporter small permease subunit [Candidatus Puniceispirillum sp. TMED176]|tara:strand:+ start:4017 stop:4574 length:558 start_codon:yes stop_codon:yes gene_type:complete
MRLLASYIRLVDRFNYRLGRVAMYLLFAMMAILFWSSLSKIIFRPSLWTLEMAQFVMVGYYMIGGPYSIQLGSNVRMDLMYRKLDSRQKAWMDGFTVLFLITYLAFLLYGGINSTIYSLQFSERSYSVWQPYMWPVKLVMVTGIILMLLQSLAELARDILNLQGHPLPPRPSPVIGGSGSGRQEG